MSRQSDELSKYFTLHGIPQTEIAEKLGVTAPVVSNLLAGRGVIGKKRAYQLASAYGFNLYFLLTGEGELLPPQSCSATNSRNVIQSSPGSQIGTTTSEQELQMECSKLRAEAAALQAENERLKDEVSWLRSIAQK